MQKLLKLLLIKKQLL